MKHNLLIVGAGPIGIELAIHALDTFDVTICERAPSFAGNVREWGHVSLFSPWDLNVSNKGKNIAGLEVSDDAFPTGDEYLSNYLGPLWSHLSSSGAKLLTNTRVVSMTKSGKNKGDMKDRGDGGFKVLVEKEGGEEELICCDKVCDCSGTWGNRNYVGEGGMPALGERKLGGKIIKGLPKEIGKFEGKTTMVVGSGASAITFIASLVSSDKGGEIVWVTRRNEGLYERIENDPLPQRDALSVLAQELIKEGGRGGWKVTHKGGGTIKELKEDDEGRMEVTLGDGTVVAVDELVSATGYRPDTTIFQELQVHQCYATEGPMKLAAALMSSGGGGGDCLAQVSQGPETLMNPEKGFFVLGMKSYGRGSAFLLKVGIDQVRMVMELLKQ
eukprot:CAMPEP_0118656444 /NCGR_PEP_ID=MMETSP0785-20121206/13492_1 /TAXON_ID=91992 /ORGANISM="Bolidomonas pacifica, Strain CCMP 1866" /LENGTH=386 /DNA_ID=CAMNT_0006549303 /DNA_START=106 /DNA_END=1266 /DNA_ORIENTATION=-